MVEYLNKNLPGIFIPTRVKERMKGKDVGEGIKISRELIDKINKYKEVAGIHIFPLRDMNLVCLHVSMGMTEVGARCIVPMGKTKEK